MVHRLLIGDGKQERMKKSIERCVAHTHVYISFEFIGSEHITRRLAAYGAVCEYVSNVSASCTRV